MIGHAKLVRNTYKYSLIKERRFHHLGNILVSLDTNEESICTNLCFVFNQIPMTITARITKIPRGRPILRPRSSLVLLLPVNKQMKIDSEGSLVIVHVVKIKKTKSAISIMYPNLSICQMVLILGLDQ